MIETKIIENVGKSLQILYGQVAPENDIQIQKTRKEFEGDFTLIVFPLLKFSKKSPEITAEQIGEYLFENLEEVSGYIVIKGFLNIIVDGTYWVNFVRETYNYDQFGYAPERTGKPYVVEYSAPNTNKPMHLGHIRNNLLGFSVAEIIKANGKNVIKVNLINDRGIHICKSMLAWENWGNGETPESTGMKGDHFIGKYYVLFEQKLKQDVEVLMKNGFSKEEALKESPLMQKAQKMLRKWEYRDEEVLSTWKKMNSWAYTGFDETYKRLGVDFDKVYYESDTYLLGKEIVEKGIHDKVLSRKEDNSVWADLSDLGLDEKLLLRSDGTSVYMTQDLGTAQLRYDEYDPEKLIYVVGNEQNYHFTVLQHILLKLGKEWANNMVHLSYGMVELPSGKMKSREGTVVDADELIEEMLETAKRSSQDLGKVDSFRDDEAIELYRKIGLGALKYFILKVDPRKNMLFNPEESIDFNGNTGPFIQYTYARIQSVLRKAKTENKSINEFDENRITIQQKEKDIVRLLHDFPGKLKEAAENYNPAIIANFSYDLAKEYNQFYQEIPILKAECDDQMIFRLQISVFVGTTLMKAMSLLGIDVPDRM